MNATAQIAQVSTLTDSVLAYHAAEAARNAANHKPPGKRDMDITEQTETIKGAIDHMANAAAVIAKAAARIEELTIERDTWKGIAEQHARQRDAAIAEREAARDALARLYMRTATLAQWAFSDCPNGEAVPPAITDAEDELRFAAHALGVKS